MRQFVLLEISFLSFILGERFLNLSIFARKFMFRLVQLVSLKKLRYVSKMDGLGVY